MAGDNKALAAAVDAVVKAADASPLQGADRAALDSAVSTLRAEMGQLSGDDSKKRDEPAQTAQEDDGDDGKKKPTKSPK